jgi:hypothetical protein
MVLEENWAIFGVNVGTYSSTMEHLGIGTMVIEKI